MTWELVAEHATAYDIPVQKYRSSAHGMLVYIVNVHGPLVNGFLTLATEDLSDDGLPHTLEHLVFMGSDRYPYKGLLDQLANRCFAQGTNAWTDVDHTCYTMTTAGKDGFLNLLPIYVDHILYATCSEPAFVTEVHHITPDGDDAGVVYCEMQARENTDADLTHLHMVRHMYPGVCGFKSETGGLLENLRTSTTHKKVFDYHREFYRPDNLAMILVGDLTLADVTRVATPIEEAIAAKGPLQPFPRPWSRPVPPLEASVSETVPFPSDDETAGLVKVAWRGPPCSAFVDIVRTKIMWDYLTKTPVAPLQREFVEQADPLCNDVSASMLENKETCQYVEFENVPVEKLGEVKTKLFAVLARLADGSEPLDMERMATLIKRRRLRLLSQAEDHPQYLLAFACIGDFLYGRTPEELAAQLDELRHLELVAAMTAQDWAALIDTWLLQRPHVEIVGRPSAELAESMAADEKARVAAQRAQLGEAGLADKAKTLEAALAANGVDPPQATLQAVPVPSVAGISFHPVATARSAVADAPPLAVEPFAAATGSPAADVAALQDLPFFVQADHIGSQFTTVTLLFDAAALGADNLSLVLVLCEQLFEAPVLRPDGTRLNHEQVVAGVADDLLDHHAALGFQGSSFVPVTFPELLVVKAKMENAKFARGVEWLADVVLRSVFEPERIRIAAAKIQGDVAAEKREGLTMVASLAQDRTFAATSTAHAVNLVRQDRLLSDMLARLDAGDSSDLVARLQAAAAALTAAPGLRVHVAGNIKAVGGAAAVAAVLRRCFVDGSARPADCPPAQLAAPLRKALLVPAPGAGAVLGLGAVESAYLVQTAPCVDTLDHPDLAAIMVLMEYLSALEGPMWRQIRGQGLSYGYSLRVRPEEGLIYFRLTKSSDIVKATTVANQIIEDFRSGASTFDEMTLEAAISSVIFELIEREDTPSAAATESLKACLGGAGQGYNHSLVAQVQKVSVKDLETMLERYFGPLFDPQKSICSVVCNAGKMADVVAGFKALGRDLQAFDSAEAVFA